MSDNQFDNFVNDKLRDHAAPVPAGLWEKVSEGQFDQFIGNQLKETEAPVPESLWDAISDRQFDQFIGTKLGDLASPVSADLYDRIRDGQFDQFVANKLTGHEAPVPDGLWEKVRPEEDDDKFGFIWFRYPAAALLILGILTAGAIGTYLYFKKTNTQSSVPATTLSAPVSTPVSGSKPDPGPGTQTPATDHKDSNTGLNTESSPIEKPASLSSGTGIQSNTVYSKTQPQNASGEGPIAKNNFSLKPVPKNNADPVSGGVDLITAQQQIAIQPLSSLASEEASSIPPYTQNLLNGEPITGTYSHANQSWQIDNLQLATGNHINKIRNIIICPSDRKNQNTDWFLETYVSPDLAFKSVTNVSATPQYLARKDSSESMRVGYTAGIRLVKPITDNLLVKAGLQYSQANEKYVYRTENEVKTTTVVTERTIIRGPGDTVLVKDTSVLQTIGYRNNTVYNRYRSFDIPVTVGYQFGDDDLKFGINAGVIVNLSSWYQGVILDSSLGTVNLNKSGNSVYKTNIGLGLIGGISVVKRLSDDMHIFFEPYFRFNLSDMTTPQSTFKQRFSVGGLSVGLRFNLNRK